MATIASTALGELIERFSPSSLDDIPAKKDDPNSSDRKNDIR